MKRECGVERHIQGISGTAGSRQGLVMSTNIFKLQINGLLIWPEASGLGIYIGHLILGATAVVDDVFITSMDNYQIQDPLNMYDHYSDTHHSNIHIFKSIITHHFMSTNPISGNL